MSRTPLLVAGLFLAVVGGGAAWLGPRLLARPGRAAAPPTDPPARARPPAPVRPTASRPPPGTPIASVPARTTPPLVVRTPRGETLAGTDPSLRFAGPRDPRGYAGTHVRAASSAWTRLPPTGDDGSVRASLLAPGPPIDVRVQEADGRPAADVPVAYGPEGVVVRSDATGLARLVDVPTGVLRVTVGGRLRSAPARRLRVGVDRAIDVVLDPPLLVDVRVLDEAGAPLPGARVVVVGAGGPASAVGTSGPAPVRLVARLDERLAVLVSAPGRETTSVECPVPDPRRPLRSDVEVRLPRERGILRGSVTLAAGTVDLVVEPAISEPLREAFGADDVADLAFARLSVRGGPIEVRGVPSDLPLRLSLRGGVVPEDHVLLASDRAARTLDLRPQAEAGGSSEGGAGDGAPDGASSSGAIRGRVSSADGAPLAGLTVGSEGRRTTTDGEGTFVLPGVPTGRPLEVVFGWTDGADTRGADPGRFAGWGSGTATAGGDLVAFVLPAASSARLRIADGLTGEALTWARILVLDAESNVRVDAAIASRAGAIELADLSPGASGSLFAFAPGLRREVPLALRAGAETDLGEVGLVRDGRVTGVVRDRKGAPIAGAEVAAMEDGRVERGGRGVAYARELALRRTTADAGGAYVLDGLDPTRPSIVAVAADGFAPTARRVLWTSGAEATVTSTLVRGGTVRLQVLDPSGARVGGAFVELEDARTGVRPLDVLRRAVLGSFVGSTADVRRAAASLLAEDPALPGVFRIADVEPGAYELIVGRAGYVRRRAKFTVPDPDAAVNRPIPSDAYDWRLELEPAPR